MLSLHRASTTHPEHAKGSYLLSGYTIFVVETEFLLLSKICSVKKITQRSCERICFWEQPDVHTVKNINILLKQRYELCQPKKGIKLNPGIQRE